MTSALLAASRFERRTVLGRGAFGEVWCAFDRERGAEVALKVLQAREGPAVARFKRELRSLSELHHRGLVRVYELVREADRWLLSMERVHGHDLSELGLDLEGWAPVLPQLVDALGVLHAAGVVHRDLKPTNLRLTPDGQLVVLDFGLVAAFEDHRERGLVGSPHTMAPEQAAGAPPTRASDWYALGVMLYEAATGAPPFEGRPLHVLAQKRERDAPPVRALRPEVPAVWAQLIDQLLLRDPEARLHDLEVVLGRVLERPVRLPVPTPRPPLLGRDEEQALLAAALNGSRASVRLEGPSGIGKTALLDWFVEHASEHGARVLRGRCYAQETVPHAGLDELVDALARELPVDAGASLSAPEVAALRRTFPVLAPLLPQLDPPPLDGPALRRHAARGLATLLAAASGDAPLVLVIDDVQWADLDTAWLIARVVSALAVLLVTASRAGDPFGAALDDELDRLGVTRTCRALHPLSSASVEALVHAIRGEATAAMVSSIREQSGGLPLFLVELARAEGDRAQDLDGLLGARLEACDARERALLAAIAMSSRPLERSVAIRALAQTSPVYQEDGAGAALHASAGLANRRWLRSVGTSLELAHDRLREVARSSLDDAGVRALHAALDDALVGEGIDDPERCAAHALAAGRRPRGRSLFVDAARRARAALAFHHSAELYARALGLTPPEHDRLAWSEERADTLADAGRNAEAAVGFASILEGSTGSRRAELARRCAEQWFHAGRTEEGYAALETTLRAAGLPPLRGPRVTWVSVVHGLLRLRIAGFDLRRRARPITERERLRIDTAQSAAIALTNVDSLRGMDYVLRSLRLATRAGDVERSARSLGMLANYATSGGGPSEARAAAIIAEAARRAESLEDPYVEGLVSGARTLLAFHNGRWEDAFAHAERTYSIYEPLTGRSRERVSAHIYRVASLMMRGDLVRARPIWDALREDGDARSDRFASTNARSGLMNLFWLADGDPARARAEATRAIAAWGEPRFHVQHFFDVVAQARIDLYEGRAVDALERIVAARRPLRRSLLTRMQFVRIVFWDLEARAHLAAASHLGTRRAVQTARRLARRIRDERMAWGTALAMLIEAGIARLEGQSAESVRRALVACAALTQAGMDGHAHAARSFADTASPWPDVANPARFAQAIGLGQARAQTSWSS